MKIHLVLTALILLSTIGTARAGSLYATLKIPVLSTDQSTAIYASNSSDETYTLTISASDVPDGTPGRIYFPIMANIPWDSGQFKPYESLEGFASIVINGNNGPSAEPEHVPAYCSCPVDFIFGVPFTLQFHEQALVEYGYRGHVPQVFGGGSWTASVGPTDSPFVFGLDYKGFQYYTPSGLSVVTSANVEGLQSWIPNAKTPEPATWLSGSAALGLIAALRRSRSAVK